MLADSKSQAGDTIIEVIFATALAALIIVMALSAMNRGLAQIQMAAETTIVRQSLDSEAETIRMIRDVYQKNPKPIPDSTKPLNQQTDPIYLYSKMWTDQIIPAAKANASAFGTCTAPSGSFVLKGERGNDTYDDSSGTSNIKFTSSIAAAPTYAQVGRGIWMEAVEGTGASTAKYIDFHIRACWEPPFSSGQNATIGTVVRLYYE